MNYSKENLFDDYAIEVISQLLSKNFSITLRPHPEHYKRSEKKLKQIKNLFLNNNNFNIDESSSNIPSLEKAEILITDNSSIVFEFILIFKRPIVYLEYKDKLHNSDRYKINIKTFDSELKKKFGNCSKKTGKLLLRIIDLKPFYVITF